MPSNTTHIIYYRTDPEADKLLINILSDYFASVLVVDAMRDICRQLISKEQKVFLITGPSVVKCLSAYYRSLDAVAEYPVCEHRVVAMVPRHEEAEAYQAFRSGIVDDYMVARPVYEMHRVILICEHLLASMGIAVKHKKGDMTFVREIGKVSEDVGRAVSRGLERRELLRSEFEQTMLDIDKALDGAVAKIRSHQPVDLDLVKLRETLSAIRSDEVRPELLKLQQKTMNLIGELLDNVNLPKGKNDDAADEANSAAFETPASDGDNRVDDENNAQETSHYTFNRLYSEDVDYEQILQQQKSTPSILLVEDDAISAQLTKKLLNHYKIKVDVAANGRVAFASLSNRHYSLVLMDVTLPDTNGIYIVDQVCTTDGPNKDTPIVMLSGRKDKITVQQAVERGAKGYIVKPLYKESLEKLFEKFGLNIVAK